MLTDYDDAVKGICGPILAAEIERVALRLYSMSRSPRDASINLRYDSGSGRILP